MSFLEEQENNHLEKAILESLLESQIKKEPIDDTYYDDEAYIIELTKKLSLKSYQEDLNSKSNSSSSNASVIQRNSSSSNKPNFDIKKELEERHKARSLQNKEDVLLNFERRLHEIDNIEKKKKETYNKKKIIIGGKLYHK